MAKTYSFDEIFAPSETTQAVTPTVSSPKLFSFDDVMKMQPVEEPAAPVTTPAVQPVAQPIVPTSEAPVAPEEKGFLSNIAGSVPKSWLNLKQAVVSMTLPDLIGLKENAQAKYGSNYENASEAQRLDFLNTEKVISEKLATLTEYGAETKALNAKYGLTPIKQKIEDLQKNPEYEQASTFDQFKKLGSLLLDNPASIPAYLATVTVETLPTSFATIAPAILGRYAGFSSNVSAAIGGTSSAMTEFGGNYMDLREKGMSHDEAWEKAAIKSGVIGLLDAASFKTAGAAAEKIFGQAQKAAITNGLKVAGKEAGVQAGLGAGGEGLGTTIINEKIDPVAVLEEAAGEVAGAPAKAFSTYREGRKPGTTEKVEPPLGTTTEETTTEPAAPSTKFDYMDTPEYQAVMEKITEASAKSETLQANIDSFAEGTPERSEAIRQYIDFFDNTLNPLFEERNNLKPTEEVTEPSATEVAEPAKTSDQDIIWMDQQAMNDELSEIESEANKPARVEPTFTEAEPVAETVEAEPATLTVQEQQEALNKVISNLDIKSKIEAALNPNKPVAETTEELQPGDTVTFAEATAPQETVANEPIDLFHGTKAAVGVESLTNTEDLGPHFTTDKATGTIFAEDQNTPGKVLEATGNFEKVLTLPDLAGWFPTEIAAEIDKASGISTDEEGQTPLQMKVWSTMESARQNYLNNAPENLNNDEITKGYLAEMQKAGYEFLREYLKSKGYDAIKYTNQFEGKPVDTYIALDLNKIKSKEQTTIAETPVAETPTKELPELDITGIKAPKGRNPYVVAAGKLFQEGKISREDFNAYVDKYTPIAEIPVDKIAPPTPLEKILKFFKSPKETERVKKQIPDGTKVGLRMDLPAKNAGLPVVSIHEGKPNDNPKTGKPFASAGEVIKYASTAHIKNVNFSPRSQEKSLNMGLNPVKEPLQTAEGEWVNTSPEDAFKQVKALAGTEGWTQVGFDPARHGYFYDRSTGEPVVRASELYQVGSLILAKDVQYGEKENFLYNIETGQNPAYGARQTRTPSLRRATNALFSRWQQGLMTSDELALGLERALDKTENRSPVQPRERGADIIREKLLAAKRRGELSEEAVDLAEWFIRQNEALVDDLGISIKAAKEGSITSGFYNNLVRIMTLIKGSDNEVTPVHEILHHLERMMPEPIRRAIKKEWFKSLLKASKAAEKGTDQNLKDYYTALLDYHINGTRAGLTNANNLLNSGVIDYEHYQHLNPSEFWATNGSYIVQGRYEATRSVLARLKNWLRDLGQKIKSTFGLRSDAAIIRALDSLAKSDGQFVTDALLSQGNVFQNIPKNYKGKPAPGASFTAPEKTRLTEAAYNLVNEQTYLKRVTEVLEKAYQVPANLNAYTKELLKNSRAAYRSKMFHLQEVRPILQLMKKYKIADDQLTEYAQAKFAEQRNKQIAARGGLADGGSGMYTADAQAILAGLSPAREAQLEQVRQMVKNIITGTQNLYVASGAETQDTIDAWNDIKNSEYVPLNRKDEDFAMGSSGLGGIGYSASGRSTRMATGSIDKDVKSILENVIHQRDVANERAERIRVGKSLYAMAIKYPNPKFWLPINPDAIKSKTAAIAELQSFGLSPTDIDHFMSQPKVARIDPKTGKLEYAADASALKADNVLVTKINGKNRYVVFNKNDPTAMAMVKALKSLPVEETGAILGIVGKATRLWSAITTQFNPIWGLFVNMPRDILWMYSTLSSTPIMGNKWEMTKKLLPAMIGSWEALRAERSGKPVTGHWAQTFQTASMDGARTMFRDSWVNAREDGEYLKNEMAKLNRGNVNKVVRGFVNVLEDFNNMLESSIRLAAYDTAIQQGLSKDEAARISKEITVNFDRRGAKTNYARNLYAFFNAAVQGSAKLYEVMKSPAGNKIMATMAGMGILQAAMLSMAGLGDDDVPDYEKEKNFIIPTGGKGYIKIPMMQGLSIFVNVGRLAWEMPMDAMNNKGRNMGKKVSSLFSSVSNAFNPFGESSNMFLGVLPTLMRPAASVSVNEDAFGRKIHKEAQPGKPTPGYLRSKENASPLGQGIAQVINKISGGSEFVQGKWSPTGDDIDYLAKQYAGGLGREITGAIKFGSAISKGEPLEVNQIPVISKYFGTSDRRGAVARNFYDNVNDIAKYNFEYKSYSETDRDAKADSVLRKYPEAELHTEAQALVRSISKISKMHEQRAKENAPKSELRALENEQFLMMREFNAEVAKTKRKR